MKRICSLLFTLAVFSAYSQTISGIPDLASKQIQLNTITTAVPFLIITPDARAAAMGDAGVGLSPNEQSIYWNTATLGFAHKSSEMSMGYSPWLRQLVDGIHLFNAAAYKKIGQRNVLGASIRYISLGEITFTDNLGNIIRTFNPNEFEFQVAYAFRVSKRSSLGLNVKYISSNLTGGITIGSTTTGLGESEAVDLSYSYRNEDLKMGKYEGGFSWGITVSNIGSKMSYTNNANRDFLPTNLRLGAAFDFCINESQQLTFVLNANKLLVPTNPVRDSTEEIMSGYENNVGVFQGMFQSFYDAPGIVVPISTGGYAVSGRGAEELREITRSLGLEYRFMHLLSLRMGYFHEHASKGARKYMTFGSGVEYGNVGLDFSYLMAFRRTNPLSNTIRLTLRFIFPKNHFSKPTLFVPKRIWE